MTRLSRNGIVVWGAVVAIIVGPGTALGHPGHRNPNQGAGRVRFSQSVAVQTLPLVAVRGAQPVASGQGKLRFRVLYTADHLPQAAVDVLVKAHGGFAVDRREGRGETYFALPGAGIIKLSPNLSQTSLIDTPAEVRDTNLHNTTIWYDTDGTPYLVFPANEAGKVFTTTLDGKLVNILNAPPGDHVFDEPTVDGYFGGGGKFVPTDVEQLDGLYYVTTGYSDLDWVLTAQVISTHPFNVKWHDLVFGGRGIGPGQFGTGHGITVTPDRKRIDVADRPNAEIDRFTRYGQYRDTIQLPEGSFPCDIDFVGPYAIVGCLHGPNHELGAPIYILQNDEVVSTVLPKEELGLANFQHIHNATAVLLDGKLYLIAQAWNPGDFAILEQVAE